MAGWPGQFSDWDQWPSWAIKGFQPAFLTAENDPLRAGEHRSYIACSGELAEAIWYELLVGTATSDPRYKDYHMQELRNDAPLNRDEYAAVLTRTLGLKVDAPAKGQPWWRPYQESLAKFLGIQFQNSDFTAPIYRREMGEWLGRIVEKVAPETAPGAPFADLGGLTADEIKYIRLAAGAGLVHGDTENRFNPNSGMLRREAGFTGLRLARWMPAEGDVEAELQQLVAALWENISVYEYDLIRDNLPPNAAWGAPADSAPNDQLTAKIGPFLSPLLLDGPLGYRDSAAHFWTNIEEARSRADLQTDYQKDPDQLKLITSAQGDYQFYRQMRPGSLHVTLLSANRTIATATVQYIVDRHKVIAWEPDTTRKDRPGVPLKRPALTEVVGWYSEEYTAYFAKRGDNWVLTNTRTPAEIAECAERGLDH
jgi:hypothetical protein